jgi:hypothetical protein
VLKRRSKVLEYKVHLFQHSTFQFQELGMGPNMGLACSTQRRVEAQAYVNTYVVNTSMSGRSMNLCW